MGKANNYNSNTAVKRKYNKAGRRGKIYRWVEARDLEILQRELLLLYKFRSSIVHGERDPKATDVQRLAKAAYEALDHILSPLF